ncbi:nuclear transport factor 2 family protein [Epidermidibacterium keratini]|uniref:Nuclear transport factor 2 family protein n=1 Tax=Epidermidibacterium keratini TaxID=1891644 RepID=A0A7L4YLF1_9ACTN|nr:nuclear transport factor 2 family protein [Epidermidibacterium keratini]QHB99949.1 nuclear transport factor 2 family protein [Epidermidibacterium keratini]
MQEFQRAVEADDQEAIQALLADDVVFRSPAVHTPYRGKAATSVILAAVGQVFEDFRYTAAVEQDGLSVLVFEAHVGEFELEGADFIRVGDDGKIVDLRVMIRPLKGLNAVVEGMAKAIPGAMAQLGVSPEQMKASS